MTPVLNSSSPRPNPTPDPKLLTDDDALSNTSQQSDNSDLASRRHATSNPNIQDSLRIGVPSLLHLSFNQDHGCFAVGIDRGFMLYNCEPFGKRGDFIQLPGFRIVEMLFKSNIFALVGEGRYPQYPSTKVMIWDTLENKFTGDLSPMFEVKAVKLRRDQVIVVLENTIVAYKFSDLKPFHEIKTFKNPKGLCEVSQVSGSCMLVCPGLQKGQVRIEHYEGIRRTRFFQAHDSRLACIALSQDGKLLATASTKGTIVRIYNTIDGSLLQEVRRGAYRADIYSIAFSPTAQWLCCSSDKGTVHVFAVKVNSGVPNVEASESSSSSPSLLFLKKVAPKYFNSEVSVAQFRLPEDIQNIVGFGNDKKNTIVIVGVDGSFYRCQFDPAIGGEMIQLEYYNFLSPANTF